MVRNPWNGSCENERHFIPFSHSGALGHTGRRTQNIITITAGTEVIYVVLSASDDDVMGWKLKE